MIARARFSPGPQLPMVKETPGGRARGGAMGLLRPWWVHSAFGALVLVLAAAYLVGGMAPNVAVVASSVLPPLVLAVQLHRGPVRSVIAWRLLISGFALLVAHNLHSLVIVAGSGDRADGPTHAATLVLGYVLVMAGGAIATVPLIRVDVGGMIDATIVGLSLVGAAWVLAVRPGVAPQTGHAAG
ncbi:MAG TPA: hypothetical protein PKB06_01260, partial [Actinotalea sp.]|nr:hypothetical protein [Actinotalea sp.]